jgi:hypothetical protein
VPADTSSIRPSMRSLQSELDRRAISAAGHLLFAGIWLERRFTRLPKLGSTRSNGPGG